MAGEFLRRADPTTLPLAEPVLQVLRLWREHTPYRSEEDWIFASPHYHGKTPYTYQILFRHIRPVNRESLWNQEQQGSTDRVAHATPLTSDIADLQRGECEGRTIAAPPQNSKNHLGTLRSSRFDRPAASSREGPTDGVSNWISGEIESKKHYGNRVRTVHSLVLGVRGCPKQSLPTSANCFRMLVSAAGIEPATHALKGRCSTN